MTNLGSQDRTVSVTEAVNLANKALSSISLRVLGEVSQVSKYNVVTYITLKDANSVLKCKMWTRGKYGNIGYEDLDFQFKVGLQVDVIGKFGVYGKSGEMQFNIEDAQLAGEGKLRQQVAALAERLRAEGLMEPSRKRSIPDFPEKVGIVTSGAGAVIHEVLRKLRGARPIADVLFADASVGGERSASEIIEALNALEQTDADVILLVRGGGSFEDLMPFNDEKLVRKIASMHIPVVTGIGHEPDTTIADMVADLRASTPTDAAVRISVSSAEAESELGRLSASLGNSMRAALSQARGQLQVLEANRMLSNPMEMMRDEEAWLERQGISLASAMQGYLERVSNQLGHANTRLASSIPSKLARMQGEVEAKLARLTSLGHSLAMPFERSISSYAASLEALSPLAVLSRGYSILREPNGKVLRRAAQVEVGTMLEAQLSQGSLKCKVADVLDDVSVTEVAM